MVTLQIINKVLSSGDMGIILNNSLTPDQFLGYEEEFNFLMEHNQKYGMVPDKETFLSQFTEFSPIEVQESDRYLLDTLFEETLYYKSVGVVQKVAELLKVNSNDAVEYLQAQIPELTIKRGVEGVNIIKQAGKRLKIYQDKKTATTPWFITTGFEEMDDILHGWSKGEEFIVFFARSGQGKSWILSKTLTHAWQIGNRVGYISPEMSPEKMGYRIDTLNKNFSNSNLIWGKEEEGYEQYIQELTKHENPFIIATPADFQKKVTVNKLRNFIKTNKLDILGVDGITYLSDERYKKGDNKNTSLTNISEDLMALSLELGVPILVVTQSNRGGVKSEDEEGTPELETIRDSDGIAHNASKVIALRQTGPGIEFGIKKHRDGATGGKLTYFWDIDKGQFNYVPDYDDAAQPAKREGKVKKVKASFKDGEDAF